MEALKYDISTGSQIKWVGYHSERHIWVHTVDQKQTLKKHVIHLKENYTETDFKQVLSCSATEPGTITGTIWSSNSRLELLRLASILGINVGSQCIPGCGQEFKGTIGCIMGYDIETDRTRIPVSSFGTPSESILSIAMYCSCGYNEVLSFIPNVNFKYIKCKDSKDTVSKFIERTIQHSPQWLIGFNNFGFDNTRIAYHSDEKWDSILIPMTIGSGSSLTYAYYIDIEGVYNVDLLTYLDKTRRSTYPNMSLATLVSFHGIEKKINFDTTDMSSFEKLFEYNLHDSKITMELAKVSNSLTEIVSLCSASCVPVIDAARFVTGTFAACSVASYCLSNKISMDWSSCRIVQEYKGAEVLKPVIGVHEDVVSCDFSSMYPTILVGANISIENFTISKSAHLEGSAWNSQTSSNFVVNGKQISFDNSKSSILPPVMKLFIDRRREVRKHNPAYGLALKISANSLYGMTGDPNSKIYSPQCSAAVTTGGRWCLAVAESIIKVYGFQVVYGDTDSCYIKSTTKCKCSIEDMLQVMKHIFVYTPFSGMSMEIEDRFTKVAFMGKKTYFGKTVFGKTISKGMSKSRKDRIGVCRSLTSHIVEILLSNTELNIMRTLIADMVSSIIDLAVTRQLQLSDVSKYVKKGGSNHFEYKLKGGQRDTLECETHIGTEVVNYSSSEIATLVSKEVNMLLKVAALGSLSYIISHSSII